MASARNSSGRSRRYQRIAVRVPVALRSRNFGLREAAFTGNVSLGGIFIHTDNYGLDRDEKVCLEIDTGGGRRLSMLGTVCWSNLFPVHEAPDRDRGIGVRLLNADSPEYRHWVQSLAPTSATSSN